MPSEVCRAVDHASNHYDLFKPIERSSNESLLNISIQPIEIPKAVLTYDITATGAGDVQGRAMTSGRVLAPRLIVHADGDNSNITDAILDQLRDYSITAVPSVELNILDNGA